VTSRTGERAERARLFVGLELPVPVRGELTGWCSAHLGGGTPGLRPVEPEALHVTLCFLGWRPVEQIGRIVAACEDAVSGPPAELVLGAPVWLGSARSRVIAVGLGDRSGTLSRLQQSIVRTMVAVGCHEPEERPFLPHVTVARSGRRSRVSRRELPPPAPVTFMGRDVTLFRSWAGLGAQRDPPRARYETLRTISLGG
jgi:RNA 2',3'-cyclic 3'-phosphodiesterase